MHTKIGILLDKKGWTQSKLAKLTGISQGELSKYIKGTVQNPAYKKLVALARVFGVTVDDITDFEKTTATEKNKETNELRNKINIASVNKKEVNGYTRLKEIRRSLNMSQKELAKLTKVSQSNISKIERGTVLTPSHSLLASIARAFNLQIEDLSDEPIQTSTSLESSEKNVENIYIPRWARVHKRDDDFPHGDAFIIDKGFTSNHQIRRPSFLEYSDTVYAVSNPSSEIFPRYNLNDILFVDPKIKEQEGDDVAILFEQTDKLLGIVRTVSDLSLTDQIIVKSLVSGHEQILKLSDIYRIDVIVGMNKNRF